MTNGIITPCDYARERHGNIAKWRNLWTILMFTFGTTVVIFLIFTIIFFLRQDWLPAGLTTLGTIVQSVGIKWVVDRRIEAVKEEEAAYKDVEEKCKNTAAADTLRMKQKLFLGLR